MVSAMVAIRKKQMQEIRAAISFYETHRWDWISVVAYLSSKAFGSWPIESKPWKPKAKQP